MNPHRGLVVTNRTPNAADALAREELLARHGVTDEADAEFDAITDLLAAETGFRYAMVNLVIGGRQRFIGLHNPSPEEGPAVGRDMALDEGFCPHVRDRKLGLSLPSVYVSRLYAGNTVVDALGIQSYVGEVLIYPGTRVVLGTVCVIDQRLRSQADARPLMRKLEKVGEHVMGKILAR